jgi:outer membrane receptor protein involved in Fe transport
MSDQAQFTGFDDGNSTKAINIITKSDKRNGQFGKLYGGYGTDDRFQGGGALNLFTPGRKFSIIGLGNNINQQNFSSQDILGLTNSSNSGGRFGNAGNMGSGRRSGSGGGGRGGSDASNFMVGTQDGNTNTYSTGINFTDNSVKDLTVNLSYFFNNAKNTTDQNLERQYFSKQTYDENSEYTSNNLNHRINGRVEYALDTLNSLVYTPKIYFQNNNSTTDLFGENYLTGNIPLSSAKNHNETDVNGYQISNELLLRHKFSTPGRTISFDISGGINFKRSNADVLSISDYIKSGYIDTLDEKTNGVLNGRNISGNLVYTEPLGLKSQLQINASGSLKRNVSDKKADSLDVSGSYYNILDTLHSNVYANDFKTLSGGISYRWNDNPYNLTIGLAYQKSILSGDQTFPRNSQVDKTFENVLPNLRFMWRPSRSNFLRFSYNTSVNAPSIDQLQNTIDNSNTLSLKGGNPDLKAEYNHRLMSQYISTNVNSGTNFFTMLMFSYTGNSISNATVTATKDSTLSNGMILNNGSQFVYPVNLDHSMQLRSFSNAGFMIEDIRSTMNFNASATYTTTPGLINDVKNISKTTALGAGVMVTSNISEDVDYRIGYNPTYNETRNDVQKSLNNNYIIHNANASFYWMYYGNLFIRTDVTYYYNSGLSGSVQKDYYLWNAAIGSKLFADKTGEIKLEVFDILKQNKSLTKTVSDTYIEDRNTQVLKQYVLLTFTYNLKRF